MIGEVERLLGGDRVWTAAERGAVAEALGRGGVAVAQPPDEVALARLLALAGRRRLGVVPWGAGSQSRGGPVPEPVDLVVVTSDLSAIVAFDPGDETITVGAGCPMAEVARVVDEEGLALPFDVPPRTRATAGGFVAAGEDGPSATGLGPLRDHLLGCRLALSDGRLLRSGGRLVKNVTGYDFHRVQCGARGALGVLTEVTFRLRPRPEAVAARFAVFGEAETAADFLIRERRRGADPERLVLAAADTVSAVLRDLVDGGREGAWFVFVEHEGLEPDVRERSAAWQESAHRAGALAVEGIAPETMAAVRGAWIDPGAALAADASVRLELVHPPVRDGHLAAPGLLESLFALAARFDRRVFPVADPALGRVRLYLSERDAGPLAAGALERVTSIGGRARLLAAPASMRRRLAAPVSSRNDGDLRIVGLLKSALDPAGVLAPGCVGAPGGVP